MAAAARRGVPAIGGLAMLVAQAERQFEIWTGQRPPPGLFEAAARRGLERMNRMKQTTFDEFEDLARRGTFVPVVKEIMADLLTPVSAFLKIAEHSDYAFLFESVEGGEQVARYSFLGKDPFLVLRSRGGKTIVDRAGRTTETEEPFVPMLRPLMAEFRAPFVQGLPRFTGGAVGFSATTRRRWFEPALEAAWAGIARRVGSRRRRRCRIHAVRYGAGVRSREAPDPDHRQRAHHGGRGSRGAVSVRLREDSVPRARARARAVAAAPAAPPAPAVSGRT